MKSKLERCNKGASYVGFVASPTPASSLPGLLFCTGLSFILLWSQFSEVWKGVENEDRAIYSHPSLGYETYVGSYLKSLTKGGDWRSLGEGWLCFVCNTCMGPTGAVSEHLVINKSIFSTSW